MKLSPRKGRETAVSFPSNNFYSCIFSSKYTSFIIRDKYAKDNIVVVGKPLNAKNQKKHSR